MRTTDSPSLAGSRPDRTVTAIHGAGQTLTHRQPCAPLSPKLGGRDDATRALQAGVRGPRLPAARREPRRRLCTRGSHGTRAPAIQLARPNKRRRPWLGWQLAGPSGRFGRTLPRWGRPRGLRRAHGAPLPERHQSSGRARDLHDRDAAVSALPDAVLARVPSRESAFGVTLGAGISTSQANCACRKPGCWAMLLA